MKTWHGNAYHIVIKVLLNYKNYEITYQRINS
jgi:hypothetical protein